jgi:hypothetical protein
VNAINIIFLIILSSPDDDYCASYVDIKAITGFVKKEFLPQRTQRTQRKNTESTNKEEE